MSDEMSDLAPHPLQTRLNRINELADAAMAAGDMDTWRALDVAAMAMLFLSGSKKGFSSRPTTRDLEPL